VSSTTFWHLPSTPYYCWSTVISTSSSGKHMVVAWSKTRAVWMVVKQLPVEMPQQCSSVMSCISTHMKACTVMKKHYTGCQQSTPFVMLFCWYFTVHFVWLLWWEKSTIIVYLKFRWVIFKISLNLNDIWRKVRIFTAATACHFMEVAMTSNKVKWRNWQWMC
jgi:hypothetical protein